MPLTPLYSILPVTITVTVVTPGALAAATSVPVAALSGAIPTGTVLKFAAGKGAFVASDADEADTSIDVEPLTFALVAGNSAGYAPPTANPLLIEDWSKLKSDALRTAHHIRAEMDLKLTAPLYTGDDASMIAYAIVLQINANLKRGITPSVLKSVASAGTTGKTEAFRDRWVDPEALAIVELVTGVSWAGVEVWDAGV